MKTWPYLVNPFLTASKKSYRQALKISAYHNAQLLAHSSNPFYMVMYEIYQPLHIALSTAYGIWLTEGGIEKGTGLTLDQLLKLLVTSKIIAWENAILKVFPKESHEYQVIFPNGLTPFNLGSKEARTAAVLQLSTSLNEIPPLSAIKKDVDKFYNQLESKGKLQTGKKGSLINDTKDIEAAILSAMTGMYGNLGLLINQFKSNPLLAEIFFDVDTVRNHDQLRFKKAVKSEKVGNIIEHAFGAEDNVTLINDGTAALQFYLASTATTTAPVVLPLILFPNTQQTVAINELGDLSHHYLNVYNAEINDGHCTLEMI